LALFYLFCSSFSGPHPSFLSFFLEPRRRGLPLFFLPPALGPCSWPPYRICVGRSLNQSWKVDSSACAELRFPRASSHCKRTGEFLSLIVRHLFSSILGALRQGFPPPPVFPPGRSVSTTTPSTPTSRPGGPVFEVESTFRPTPHFSSCFFFLPCL